LRFPLLSSFWIFRKSLSGRLGSSWASFRFL